MPQPSSNGFPWFSGFTRRGKNEEIIDRVKELFQGAEAAHLLQEGRNSEDRLGRRFFYEASLGGNREGDAALVASALQDSDFQIRAIAARALASHSKSAENQKMVKAALESPFSSVRHEALRAYAERYPEAAEAELTRALLDANISVREEAQFYLSKNPNRDLREFYLQKLAVSTGKTLAVSLAGLGETGKKEDVALVSPYLSAIQPLVRGAAIRAVAKLDPAYDASVFLTALCDESAKVGREASKGLQKRVNSVGGARLWEAFIRCNGQRAKCGVLFLIARLSKWDSLRFLIRALGDPDTNVSEAASRYKMRLWRRWNRSFVQPTSSQAEDLRTVLATNQLLIPPEEKRRLESYL